MMLFTRSALLPFVTLLTMYAVVGCGASSAPEREDAPSADDHSPAPPSAVAVVEAMLARYQTAKTYFDNAEYVEHFAMAGDGVLRQSHEHVVSVLLERPNRCRVTRYVPSTHGPPLFATVVSDGKTLQARVSDLDPQLLTLPSPVVVSRDSIAADPLLASSLFPVPIENLFPQLALLLATDAAGTWPLTQKDRLVLLSPKVLEREENGKTTELECHRVKLPSDLGDYVYWIEKKTHLLHRLELPSGDAVRQAFEQRSPDRKLAYFSLSIEFLEVAIDEPHPENAFVIETFDSDRPVEKFSAAVQSEPDPTSESLGDVPETPDESQDKGNDSTPADEADLGPLLEGPAASGSDGDNTNE